jgi:hypothetical protein
LLEEVAQRLNVRLPDVEHGVVAEAVGEERLYRGQGRQQQANRGGLTGDDLSDIGRDALLNGACEDEAAHVRLTSTAPAKYQ